MHYYEIVNPVTRKTHTFNDIDDAITYAESVGAVSVQEIGGSWYEFTRCAWCEEWQPLCDFDGTCYCVNCRNYLKSRGEL